MQIIIGFGANIPGLWGPPLQTIRKTLRGFQARNLEVKAVSRCYQTAPAGPGNQQTYLNGVVIAECRKPAPSLLATLKQMERSAGRRGYGIPSGPRPLDLDILDYGGLVLMERDFCVPHPRLHLRPFVLRPLVDVAPDWIHPVLRRSATQLWQSNSVIRQGRILNVLAENIIPSC